MVYGMRTDRKLSVYESIIESIKRDLASGIFAEGERLPSCRDMAMKLGINPNTVQRAYSELEAQGVIYTIPKKGVYAGGVPPLPSILSGASPQSDILKTKSVDRQNRIPNGNSEAYQTVKKLKEAGILRDELIEIIDEVFKND